MNWKFAMRQIAGVELTDENGGGVGVRLRKRMRIESPNEQHNGKTVSTALGIGLIRLGKEKPSHT